MFRHSLVCLAYYDEDGDRLQRRKEPIGSIGSRWALGAVSG